MILNSLFDRSAFVLEMQSFEGPIDLLLHLVKKRELELNKLSLAQVCEQYLGYISLAKELDLDLASEYLVIAATLVSIKSNIILNNPVEFVEDEDGNFVDLHEELLRMLREAEVYKQAVSLISNSKKILGDDVFPPISALDEFDAPEEGFMDHDSYLLVKAFRQALSRIKDHKTYQIVLESVSIVERMSLVLSFLEKTPKVNFQDILGESYTKSQLVGTFLALLELSKRQVIRVSQTDDTITLMLAGSATGQGESFDSEFDQGFEPISLKA